MKLTSKIVRAVFYLVFTYSCNHESGSIAYMKNRKIRVDSLVLVENPVLMDESLLKYGKSFPLLVLSSVLTNISNDTLLIDTNPNENIILGATGLQIKNKTFVLNHDRFSSERLFHRWDILSPDVSKKYDILYLLDSSQIKYGRTLYLNVGIPLYFPGPDTSYLNDSTFWILPYKYDKILQEENRLLFKIDLLDNTVHLLDSTFENILEHYKCRNFIQTN